MEEEKKEESERETQKENKNKIIYEILSI